MTNILSSHKIFGISWNMVADELPLHNAILCVLTKRGAVFSIFDPLGYFAPTILEAKIYVGVMH